MSIQHRLPAVAASILFALLAAPAAAITPGHTNHFNDGSTQGWTAGAASPVPPAVQAGGGPAGAADSFLQIVSFGGFGPGSRLVAFSDDPGWDGDYLAAGVQAINMQLNNLGDTDLLLRLRLEGQGGQSALSREAVSLPAHSGWRLGSFSLLPADLVSPPGVLPVGSGIQEALSGLQTWRLYHSADASFPGLAMAAMLGIDDVTAVAAVPEPGVAWMLGVGVLALALGRRPAR